MPGFSPVTHAMRDLADDLAYHGLNLVQGVFDLVCIVALGASVYATSLGGETVPEGPLPSAAAQASQVPADLSSLCLANSGPAMSAQGGCITAQVLDASIGT